MEIAFYDLETTGLNYYHDQIIEVAAQKGEMTFCHLCQLCQLTNPEQRLPAKIKELTGIKEATLQKAETEKRVLQQFCHFIGRSRKIVYLIAHNNEGFDKWFLKTRAKYHSTRLPTNWRYVDSIQLAKIVYSSRDSYSLWSLCRDLNVKQMNAHRAGDDVRCLREIFIKMANKYNEIRGLEGKWDEHIDKIWIETQCQ